MIEIITEKKEWNLLVEGVDAYDFYSTYDYHILACTHGEQPLLIKYLNEDVIIGIPLLIREIPHSPYFDATSVYGYSGPLTKNVNENFNNENFKRELNEFFVKNKIVSVFSRLNPYIPYQRTVLNSIGEIKLKGDIVMIDLDQNIKEQKKQYQKRVRTHINKARKLCILRKAETEEDIKTFIKLYYENMERVGAKRSYFFSDDYFFKFTDNDQSQIEILLASLIDTGEVISGGMFLKTKDIVQYHLSGTQTEYLDVGALKLMIDEVRINATNEGYKVFNLGGGLNSNNDSLLRFKKSFSKKSKKFSVWQYIVNETVYEELSENLDLEGSDYFPIYRKP